MRILILLNINGPSVDRSAAIDRRAVLGPILVLLLVLGAVFGGFWL
ncbi:MAG TPA: hypothetical protein VGS97_09790 [Actinocrinis sp.]|nr:hypothetical protein [Actinocrinis sp.]HEV2344372.1 hypothetical protein [Actinocrinis sp.]